ncbi:TNF receptor-associated factor 1 [Crotalus tigris]|uniref:TNF receptor-associated factor 1 n=1 Tax=Crotalus tigris TaxID=88082 RepID=UPI00192F2C05|nr:TNF receptor-associated factor 1 [Crotalus tigris]
MADRLSSSSNSCAAPPTARSPLDGAKQGSPFCICANAGEPKDLCSHSRILLQGDLQNPCRNPYYTACLTWRIRNNSNPTCQDCEEEDSELDGKDNLPSEEKGPCKATLNKEILEFAVHCGIPGCNWKGPMSNLEDHRRMCEYVLVNYGQAAVCRVSMDPDAGDNPETSRNECQNPSGLCRDEGCRFSRIGCLFKGNAGDQKVHEKNAAGRHLLLLLQYVNHLKGSSSPRGSQSNSPLIDAKLLMKAPLTLKIQDPGGERSFSASPGEEWEVSWCTFLRRVKRVSWLETKLQVFENITAVLSKEMVTSRQKILAFRGQRGLDQDMIRGLELKIADLQRCLAQKDAALVRLEKRLHFSEQASYDGVFLWKITDVHQKCYEAICGKFDGFQSPAFYTSRYGYKLCMRIYLNGEGRGRGTHVSLFIVLLKGDYDALLPWPFTHKITFMLLSQDHGDHLVTSLHPDPTSASFQRPAADTNEASGFARFVPLAKLQSPKYTYLKEGTLFLKAVSHTENISGDQMMAALQ